MKTIIYLLLTFSLAHANVYKWIPETEKVFLFESKAHNDSPDGLGIKTEVRVQAFADHTLRMKFEGAQLYHKINSTLDLPVGPVVSKLLLGYLEETVLVQLKRGHVKSFFVSRDEPNVVTNIKRSFIFQIGDKSGFDHLKLRWNWNGMKIEFLRKEAIVARLPLPSKIRQETSLLPTTRESTSSVVEGTVDQIRLCDSDKDCPEGTRCLSHCNRWACVVQCIPSPDNNPVATNQNESTDVSCTPWPETKEIQLHGCTYEKLAGGWDWKELDPRMRSSDFAKCETLCRRERENGCCYLSKEEGCMWVPGSSSLKYKGHTSNTISVSCKRTGCADDVDYDRCYNNDCSGYDTYECRGFNKYCSDSYTGDWYRKFRSACKSTCSRYASSYCTNVTCIGCADEYLGYDTTTMKNGYNCEDYKAQCRSDYTSEWSKKVRAACKNTCSHYASEYCTQNTCKAIQGTGFHIAAQGQSCSDIGQMSMKSGLECKEAATAFGKVMKSEINAQPGWCIFHNNEMYWDIQGAGLWKPESQEICSNDGWFPKAQPGTSDSDYQVMSQETMSHNKAAIKRIKKSPNNTIAKRIGEAATWTWDFIKTPFT